MKEIMDENVKPSQEQKAWRIPKPQLQAMFKAVFKDDFDYYDKDEDALFLMTDQYSLTDDSTSDLTEDQRNIALSLICGGEYTEDDLVHLRISDRMNEGWAFTRDSFCVLMKDGTFAIIPYQSLDETTLDDNAVALPDTESEGQKKSWLSFRDMVGQEECGDYTHDAIKKYLTNMKRLFHKK